MEFRRYTVKVAIERIDPKVGDKPIFVTVLVELPTEHPEQDLLASETAAEFVRSLYAVGADKTFRADRITETMIPFSEERAWQGEKGKAWLLGEANP